MEIPGAIPRTVSRQIGTIVRDITNGGFPGVKTISPRSTTLLRSGRLSFSSTIFSPSGPGDERAERSLKNFQVARDFFGDAPDLLQRETPHWYLLDEEKDTSPTFLSDKRTHLHTGALQAEGHQSVLENLVNPQRLAELRNPQTEIYQFLKRRPHFGSFSFHIGAAAEELKNASPDEGFSPKDIHWIPGSPVLPKNIVKNRIVDCLNNFQGIARNFGFSGWLLAETLDYHEDTPGVSAYAHVTEPDFIADVLRSTGYDLLLDVGHLLITAGNKKINYQDYLAEIIGRTGLDCLREIHLSVPEKSGKIWFDNHRSFSEHLASEEVSASLNLLGRILWLKMRFAKTPLLINFEFREEPLLAEDIQLVIELVRRISNIGSGSCVPK